MRAYARTKKDVSEYEYIGKGELVHFKTSCPFYMSYMFNNYRGGLNVEHEYYLYV